MSNRVLLRVEDLHLQREDRQILRRVHLAVAPGQVFALLGRNGSGKSSLAYTLMGCAGYAPQRGRILFAGQEITRLPMTERARLGLTLAWQEPARFEGLKVRDYLALGMQSPSQERMEEALEAVALSPLAYLNRPVNETLSGGERKRIELAAVYAMRPRLAILDEPDSGIDVLSLEDIGHLIRRMAAEGTTVLLITHRDEMVPVADAAALMCEGEIVRVGDPEEVRRHYTRRCRPCELAEVVEEARAYERF
ncbi:MAG TPA: ABC transporter ATP-binding protein [Anaerolineae bacterium]|nr:ABC transporter ATP-binding protein [Anaerolineae bacterium]